MKRTYHRYEKWECFNSGFFSNSIDDKENLKQHVVELFTDPTETEKQMNLVIEAWPFSCEQNLSNPSMNRIAWLGQAACCLYAEVPFKITMEAWSLVPKKFQDIADGIAQKIIDKYLQDNA